MPTLTLTLSQDWIARFDAYARDRYPWEGPGPDTRTTKDLYKEEIRVTKREILNFERNTRAEFGGTVLADLDDPT